jgi:hypothetical protein
VPGRSTQSLDRNYENGKNVRRLSIIAVATACLLSACATKYQSAGVTGGFSDTQLAPDVFRVTFSGNARTSPDRVQDFALLRAAELCLANNFKYFAVIDSADQSRRRTYVTPGTAQTTGTVNAYGNTATNFGTTTYTPGQVHNHYKPGVGLIVQGFAEKPQGTFTYDAQFLVRSLKQKYEIQ